MKTLSKAVILGLVLSLSTTVFAVKNDAGPDELKIRVKGSIEKGLVWLFKQQNEDGSFGDLKMNPAMTSMAVAAVAKGPFRDEYIKLPEFERAVKFILNCAKEDGGIYISDWATNYHTSISLMALAAIQNIEYEKQIKTTQDFIKDLQAGNKFKLESADKDSSGGFGYRKGFSGADMSNTVMSLMALKESGLTADDEVWKRALVFVEKCQNTKVDGGGIYRPNESKAGIDKEGNYRSYQSMTYAGLLSFIYANVDKEDKRVQAAVKWISSNWDLTQNYPLGKQGLYYNYHTMAKALAAYGDKHITDSKGVKHDWYLELANTIMNLQNEEGYWVNKEDRWFETDRILITTYSILALCEGYDNY